MRCERIEINEFELVVRASDDCSSFNVAYQGNLAELPIMFLAVLIAVTYIALTTCFETRSFYSYSS